MRPSQRLATRTTENRGDCEIDDPPATSGSVVPAGAGQFLTIIAVSDFEALGVMIILYR
jgi:hypothetical protein